MKKAFVLFLACALLLSACGTEQQTIYHFDTENPNPSEPFCSIQSDTSSFTKHGTYTIVAKGYGLLATGYAYNNKEKALANPLEIHNVGYEIIVNLSNSGSKMISATMLSNSESMLECSGGGYSTAYLYVVVVDSDNFQQEFTQDLPLCNENNPTITEDSHPPVETLPNLEKPSITSKSSCWVGSSRGVYEVFAKGHGALCTGRAYSDKEKAMLCPLKVKSAGYPIIVTLSDDDTTTVTLKSGESLLISCKSDAFHGYLYVIVE